MVRVGILTALMLMLLAAACGKQELSDEKKTESESMNPYTNESVFAEVKKKLDANPHDIDALFHLADLYERNSQYEEAVEAYKKIVAIQPDRGYAYVKMGTDYNRLNKPREAVDALQKGIKYMPDNAVAYNNLGVAYGKLGRLNEERAVLRKAIKIRPGYASARFNLGFVYFKSGNRKAAMQEYESLKKIDEGVAELLLKEFDASAGKEGK